MNRKDNLEKTEKLLKFAIENGLRAKNSVKIDLDIDSSSYDQFIERVMIFIDVDLDGDGMYELRDITFELARQKKIIEEVLEHPKLQFIFRSLSYPQSYSQAKIVSDLLDSIWLRNYYSDTTHYVVRSAQRLGTIFSLGIDGKTRRSLVGLDYILDLKTENL